MQTIFYNGIILDPKNFTQNEALLIENNLILAKGHFDEVKSLALADSHMVDLQGATLMPGFNDSHMHLLGYGQSLFLVDLVPATSVQELVGLSQKFLEDHPLPAGEWVLGRGWNQDQFENPILPDRHLLDQISTSHPIFLRRACGHIGCANTLALKTVGLFEKNLTPPEGGAIDVDHQGLPTGILRENAMNMLLDKIPTPGEAVLSNYILAAQSALFSGGITSVQSDDLCVFPQSDSDLILRTFENMGLDGRLKISVHEQSLMRTEAHLKEQLNKGYVYQKQFGTFSYGPLKILGDGSLGARTAYLREDYADAPGTRGIAMYQPEELTAYVLTAFRAGLPVAIHGIGDGMIEMALKAIEQAAIQGEVPVKNLRNALVHCQITDHPLLNLQKELGVIAMVQPIFLDYDLHMVEDRVGRSRAQETYAFKTMETLGIPTCYGTDCPVEGFDVFKGIQCAITRQDLKHQPPGGWLPHEAVTIEEALRAYTLGGAYASGEEHLKGSLDKGMKADLVVLSANPLKISAAELSQIQILATYKNGQQVYAWTN